MWQGNWYVKVTEETPGFALLEVWIKDEASGAFEEAGEVELPIEIAKEIRTATEAGRLML